MKVFEAAGIRNVAVVGHSGAGKTQLISAALLDAGAVNRFGKVDEGTTVAQLFADKMPGRKAADYLVRVNRQPTPADHVLQPGDRISITPVNIEGAAA